MIPQILCISLMFVVVVLLFKINFLNKKISRLANFQRRAKHVIERQRRKKQYWMDRYDREKHFMKIKCDAEVQDNIRQLEITCRNWEQAYELLQEKILKQTR
jgi:hypothetical protein